MNDNLVRALNIAGVEKDMNVAKKEITAIIEEEKDMNIRRMMIYGVDDKLISRFGNDWLAHLYEKQYFLTDVGGTQFYRYLEDYLQYKEYDLLKVCAMILKNGFRGYHKFWPEQVYKDVANVLDIKESSSMIYMPYIPHTKYNRPISGWWIAAPILVTYLVLQGIELGVFAGITNLMKGVSL